MEEQEKQSYDTEQLWDATRLMNYLQTSRATLARWRRRGYGPRPIQVGRQIRYRPADVVAWVAAETRTKRA